MELLAYEGFEPEIISPEHFYASGCGFWLPVLRIIRTMHSMQSDLEALCIINLLT